MSQILLFRLCLARALAFALALVIIAPASGQSSERCEIDGKASGETFAPTAMAGRSGVFRCISADSGKPLRELRFVDGQVRQQREWDEVGRVLDTEFFDTGAVRKRSRQVPFDGRPAWDLEEYWDGGQLRLRGTYLTDGSAQGLVQTFHRAGPLASETWHLAGKITHRKLYDEQGRVSSDEQFHPDGRPRSSMQRFESELAPPASKSP